MLRPECSKNPSKVIKQGNKPMKTPNGLILWEGASKLDGAPIVAIATGLRKSANKKTGSMIQTWILRADTHPSAARRDGDDVSVCGNCPHRSKRAGGRGTCYVNTSQAPAAVWKAYRRGAYPTFNHQQHAHLFVGRALRIGSYGESTAVPASAWRPLLKLAKRHTGYTHTWRNGRMAYAHDHLMASADSLQDKLEANERGWRTFRVLLPNERPERDEVLCPASDEWYEQTGKRVTCEQCGLCNGSSAKKNVAIYIHGHIGKLVAQKLVRLNVSFK
jgi:hypothetical protein